MLDSELISHHLCLDGYFVIDNWLDSTTFQSLHTIAQELSQQGLLRKAKIGNQHSAQHNTQIRSDEICWLEEDSSHPAVQTYLQKTQELATLLNQSLFLNLVEFETHFATYSPGAYYKKHVDQFANNTSRRISLVYYLNQDWQEGDGGELNLYDQDDQLLCAVQPLGNRFICFRSELPHEVCMTNKTRSSIAGWMKTRTALPI